MIRALICDGDGTLPFAENGVRALIERLSDIGIQLVVATNGTTNDIQRRFRQFGLTPPDIIISRDYIKSKGIKSKGKPGAEFVFEAMKRLQVERHEVAFLGDDDDTDTFCAINAGVLPLTAMYSQAPTERNYGIPIHDTNYLIRYLSLYGSQSDPLFGWRYNAMCEDTGTEIDMRALLDQHKNIKYFKELIKGYMDESAALLPPRNIKLSAVLANYLVTRIFLNGDFIGNHSSTIVTVYPGHEAGTRNMLLSTYAEQFKNVFRSFSKDLLIRHKDAPPSKKQKDNRNIYDQFRTILVNPDENVKGKNIIVLDDYTTTGYSFEVARRMLLQAGADKVTCIAMGKWRGEQAITRIAKTWNWDPHKPWNPSTDDIDVHYRSGTSYNATADQNFYDILERLSPGKQWWQPDPPRFA